MEHENNKTYWAKVKHEVEQRLAKKSFMADVELIYDKHIKADEEEKDQEYWDRQLDVEFWSDWIPKRDQIIIDCIEKGIRERDTHGHIRRRR